MRSVTSAVMFAMFALMPGLAPVQAAAPRPAHFDLVVPATMVDDGLGVAGVDISKAGQSKQSRMTYLNSLVQDTQGNVWARCGQVLDARDAPNGVMAFCNDVMPGR